MDDLWRCAWGLRTARSAGTVAPISAPDAAFPGEKPARPLISDGSLWTVDASDSLARREARRRRQRRDEIRAAATGRIQEFLRSDRIQDRAGPDRRRRAERLRQVQSRRGPALGHGRELLQEHARLRHGGRDLRRLRPPALAQHRRSRPDARQFRPPRAGRLQRFRDHRGHPPHRARQGLDLQDQRPRGARARRATAVRRRLHRRALAGDGAAGADRRDHRRQARGAPAGAGGGRRRRRPAFAPARGGTAAEGGGGKSRPRRGRAETGRCAGREPAPAGAAEPALQGARRRNPPLRGAGEADRLARAPRRRSSRPSAPSPA